MKSILIAIVLVVSASAANAQKVGPNGGLLQGKAGHQIELVVGATELSIYMVDHDKPHTMKGTTLRAVVQSAGKIIPIPLALSNDDKLVGKLAAPLQAGAIVIVTGKDEHGDAISARYTIK